MTEVSKRDKYAAVLLKLRATIQQSNEMEGSQQLHSLIDQQVIAWGNFNKGHDAVMARAGSSEKDEHEAIYDENEAINNEILKLLADLTKVVANARLARHEIAIKHAATLRIFKRMATYINEHQNTMLLGEVNMHRSELDRLNAQLQELRLERAIKGEDEATVIEDEDDAARTYMEAVRTLGAIIPAPAPVPAPAPAAPVNAIVAAETIKIPAIKIAPFDGKLEMWETFRECFYQTIHRRENLPAPQKLQYLKSLLKGEPEELLRNFGLTAENYESAWELLNDRYNNVRELVFSHMRLITSQRKCNESAEDLRRLMNRTASALLALRNLGRPTDTWGDWIVLHVLEKLDDESLRMWEQKIGDNDDVPTWAQMEEFLKGRTRSLIAIGAKKATNKTANKGGVRTVQTHQSTVSSSSDVNSNNKSSDVTRSCSICSGPHLIQFCDTFRKMNVPDRRGTIAAKKLCFVCMNAGHQAGVCRTSRSCQTCNKRHNTMLHLDDTTQQQSNEQSVAANTANANDERNTRAQVILATALVNVQGCDGSTHQLRALLDQGSQVSFVSEHAAQCLGLRRSAASVNVIGIGGVNAGKANQSVLIEFNSRFNATNTIRVEALVIGRLTNALKMMVGSSKRWPHIVGLPLADPEFLQLHQIDLLLGGDIYGSLLLPGLRQRDGFPTAQNTVLGWVLSGRVPVPNSTHDEISIVSHQCSVQDGLTRFWELEETQASRAMTASEEQCEQFYKATVKRDDSGRLHVRLPLRETNAMFGESQHMAVQRQIQLERRFAANLEFANQYRNFMLQYEQLGHMCEVSDAIVDMSQMRAMRSASKREYYIPHHAVLKEASTTTKLRVVFDASRKSTNGFSLNDHMHVGPRLQDELTAIIMRWRRHRIGYCADVEKMYRQIVVDQPDADMQRIVWRSHANDRMKAYRLTTVTYGTTSAPYLAVKSLQTLADLERERFPRGSDIALKSFYVDDVLCGANTINDCIEDQRQLIEMLASGGFTLRKWASNSEEVLMQVPADYRELQLPLNIDDGTDIKTLGIQWNTSNDSLGFYIPPVEASNSITKRSFLSQAARLYDPLGWLAPSTVVVKMLFQQLWKSKIDWDETLPSDIADQWATLQQSICCLKTLRIPRWIRMTPTCSIQLHGFCDSSMAAYAAVVFARVTNADGTVTVHNLSAKTKVAPLKTISLPRLELCGATLLAKLITDIRLAMQFDDEISIVCWTDSTIVLAWLRADPARFNVFIANRTSEITRTLPADIWRHVKSADNPADCASRGITPQKLIDHGLWWTGPQWLCEPTENWPDRSPMFDTSEEMRAHAHIATTASPTWQWDLITNISNWRRLCRVTAWCKRFVTNCRKKSCEREFGALTVSELSEASDCWIKDAQGATFNNELRCLQQSKSIGKSSTLRSFNPILSPNKIILLGGRLANAHTLPVHARSPAIIPRRSPLGALLIADAHERTLHGGPSLMLAFLRRHYWVIDGAREVRNFVKRCTICFRFTARPSSQLMADLPAARVVPSRPFLHTALDYSGAIMVRSAKGRGHHATKAYVCVFVCLATKAIHIEVASDLSTTAFIAAYERFVGRRGACSDLYSDNATNFVGASKVFLRTERKLFDSSVQMTLAARGTVWHFSPPLSPHFNGLAESAIRSVKHHIRRVIGEATLTFEELTTVLCKVEACLNSRPIHPMSCDPADFDVLTPGHFLIGEPTVTIPAQNLLDERTSSLTRWKMTEQMVQRIWSRWSADYLHTLQQRRKWQSTEDNIRVGDMVLILEDNLPPSKWAIGRIIETHPGRDGRVRVVTIRAKNSSYKRSIVKVARLPVENETTTSEDV